MVDGDRETILKTQCLFYGVGFFWCYPSYLRRTQQGGNVCTTLALTESTGESRTQDPRRKKGQEWITDEGIVGYQSDR